MYQELEITPRAIVRLVGSNVFGASMSLTPTETGVDLRPAWLQLHSIWRGKSRREVEQHMNVQAYRGFYSSLGLDPSHTPPSIQTLVQRFLRGEVLSKIPAIHPIVDAVNVASVESMIPMGVFDARPVSGPITIDVSTEGEIFHPIGASETVMLPAGMVVLRDDAKILSQFGHRDSEEYKIRESTTSIWLLACRVPGISPHEIHAAISRATELLGKSYDLKAL